jgi:phage-related protein
MARRIIFYENYFLDFYKKQNKKVKDKILYTFELIKQVDRIPERFFKHISGTDGLYELRIEVQSNIYRIFCCFDEGKLIVLLNAFQKKTQKTPKKEIEKALRLKKQYFEQKDKNNG